MKIEHSVSDSNTFFARGSLVDNIRTSPQSFQGREVEMFNKFRNVARRYRHSLREWSGNHRLTGLILLAVNVFVETDTETRLVGGLVVTVVGLKSKNSCDQSRKNKKFTPSFQSLTSTHRRQTNRETGPLQLQCEQKSRGGSEPGDKSEVGTREMARFRHAVSPSWRGVVASLSSKPLPASDQPISHRKQIHKMPRRAATTESDTRPPGGLTSKSLKTKTL